MAEQSPVNLWQMADLCTPWCVHVVATLRIAEHIADGCERIESLAATAKCNADVLHRVLGHLVARGVFAEPEPGRFVLNDAARGLMDPALHLALDLNGIGGRMAHAWSTMLIFVRTGAPGYHELFGKPFWEDLQANPAVGAGFDDLMGYMGHGAPRGDFELTCGWGDIRTVVDVGGGTGAMLAAVLQALPHVRGTLVDFPRTVERAVETFAQAGVADRATVAGQSFFDPLPPGADLYVLRHVIHDWPDRESVALLSRCAGAARPNGRVVVLDGVRDDDAPRDITISDVLVGGKDRTVAEMRSIAQQAGLSVVAATRQTNGYFVTECVVR